MKGVGLVWTNHEGGGAHPSFIELPFSIIAQGDGDPASQEQATPPLAPGSENPLEAEGEQSKGNSLDKMRKEIRQLQEKRAAAMMNEVVELQRERDTAVARVKILKQSLEGIICSIHHQLVQPSKSKCQSWSPTGPSISDAYHVAIDDYMYAKLWVVLVKGTHPF